MVGGVAQWALTAVFAVAAGYHLVRLGLHADRWSLLDDGLHVLMSAGMVAMLWPWGAAVPVTVSVLVFTAGALWFVARALLVVSPPVVGAGGPAACGHHGSRGTAWYHAGMMASMVFMAAAMSAGTSVPATTADMASDTAMSGMAGMPGMDLGAGPAHDGTAGMAMATDAWVQVPSMVLAVVFGAAAVWWVVAGLRSRGGRSWPAVVAGALMAAGMAAVFAQMA
jgi:Domain of unknown function (DUF5134)